jgi:hypothetical protein
MIVLYLGPLSTIQNWIGISKLYHILDIWYKLDSLPIKEQEHSL